MAKKKKGFFSAVGSFLGSIPAVGKAKKAAKKATKKAKKAVKSAKKKIKAKKKKLKAKVKKAAKKLKKKAKKKIGKVFTKARKIKNNLSKSKMVKKVKKTMKKAVLTTKKAAKVVKKATKKAVKVVKKAAKKAVVAAKNMDLKQAMSTVADFIPVVSNVKAVYEVVVGKDPFTGRKIEAWERTASAASILGGPIVKGIKHGGKAVVGLVKNGGKSTKKTTAASKPKDTPKQKKQEEKKKSDTLQLPDVNKPAEVKQQGTGKDSSAGSNKTNVDDFNPKTATNKQKGNYGEIISSDNLLNNQSLKDAGYDLKTIGRPAPSGINDKIVKGIDGLYENTNANSPIKYVIDEAKFGGAQLSQKPKDGPQMSDDWLKGTKTEKNRILEAVGGDKKLAGKIEDALDEGEVERVLSKVDSNGNVKTFRLNAKGEEIGEWP